jgi:glycosyltransferase involved in cell wall biosynthesis
MRVSALTVTRDGALPRLALAIGDLARQTHAERELVVVHDADATFHAAVELLARRASLPATVERVAPGATLGELRNRAVALARGALVAQWDDDDRHHPERLARQVAALEARDASFAFLTGQLHHFPKDGTLVWEDWSAEPYPLDFVQGTLVGRRDRMPAYPAARRGEDTALCRAIVAAGEPVARVGDADWSYVYTYHSANVFAASHHRAIAAVKQLSAARMLAREHLLRVRLAEYDPPLPAVAVPCGDTVIRIQPASGK